MTPLLTKNRSKREWGSRVDYIALSRDLVHGIGIGVYIVQNRKFVYVNPFFERLTGYTSEELIGTKALNLVIPKDRIKVRKKATRYLKNQQISKSYEYRFQKKNGEIIWVLERVSPIVYMGERATLGSFMDIGERKHLEEALIHSEEIHRTMLEQMSELYAEVDLAGNFTFLNEAVYHHLGYSSEELLGKNYSCFTVEDDVKNLFDVFNEVYSMGESNKGFAHRARRKDGTVLFFETSVDLRRDEHGEICGFRSVSRDVTDHKLAEDVIHKSEQRYRDILAQIDDAYYEVDEKGNYTFFNDTMCRQLGYTREELQGLNYKAYIPPHERRKVVEAYSRVFSSGMPQRWLPMTNIRKDGSRIYVEDSIYPLRDETGKIIGLRGISRDMTERKLADDRSIMRRDLAISLNAATSLENALSICLEAAIKISAMDSGVVFMVDEKTGEIRLYAQKGFSAAMEKQYTSLGRDSPYSALILEGEALYGPREVFAPPFHDDLVAENVTVAAVVPVKHGNSIIACLIVTSRTLPEIMAYARNSLETIAAEIGTSIDLSKSREALRKSEQRYRFIADHTDDIIWTTDISLNYTFISPSVARHCGHTVKEALGLKITEMLTPASWDITWQKIQAGLSRPFTGQVTGAGTFTQEWEMYRKDKTTFWTETAITVLRTPGGEFDGLLGVTRDITERKCLEQKLEEMATHDYLTGLPNRVLLLDRFNVASALARRRNNRLAVMSLDLDQFKPINDTYGHNIGDEVLKAVGTRLTDNIRASDTAARTGGDEFVLLMLEADHVNDSAAIAQKIMDSFQEPFNINGLRLNISTSMGIAVYPEAGEDLDVLCRKSDAAMYYAKHHGRNQFKFYCESDDIEIAQREMPGP
ncbi:MAG: PAS domain S-box protein [Dehalococcoidia bacterium]|nr:PAS domain S-box protein [Dehalococcoidia bacterium]